MRTYTRRPRVNLSLVILVMVRHQWLLLEISILESDRMTVRCLDSQKEGVRKEGIPRRAVYSCGGLPSLLQAGEIIYHHRGFSTARGLFGLSSP